MDLKRQGMVCSVVFFDLSGFGVWVCRYADYQK